MKHLITKTMLALGVAATVLAGAMSPAVSAPLGAPSAASSAAVKEFTDGDVVEVRRWRGRHIAGALIGLGALALIYEGSRRHHRHYYYDPYYAYGYGYGPACIRRHGHLYCR